MRLHPDMKRLWRACVLVPVVCLAAGGLYLAAVKAVRWYEARRLEARREAERGKWERLQQAHPVEDLRRAVRESPGEFGKMLKEQGIEAGEFLRSVSSEGGQFRLGPGPSGRAFDVKFRRVIKPTEGAKPAPGGPQTRRLRYSVALNYQDAANYYSIGFAPDGVSVAKVEGWCERGIGTASSEGLAGRTSAEVVIKKRDHSLAVVLDGRTVAKAYDDAFTGGQIGFWTSSPEVAFEEVKCQPVGEIYFSDDFMRGSEQASEWETVAGQWRLNSLDNVSMSSNAFTFEGKGGERPGLAVAGHWFWDNYAFQVACQRRGDEPAGLCFGYRDAENYYAARWGAEKAQILKVRQGKATVVAEADVPIRKAEWYELRADVADETARVFVDDNLTLSIADPELSFGRVGLYAEGPNGALFDDVRVRDLRRFEDDFSKDCPGKWTPLGGSWQWHDGVMRGQATGPAKAVAGNVRWQDYELAVDVARPAQGQIGLCVNYQDEANYYVLRLDANDATLAKVAEGVGTDLATAQGVKWHEGAGRLRVVTRGGWLAAFFERDLLLQAFDAGLRAGKVGLYVDGAVADFDNVRVDFLPELRPVFTTHEVFSGELSMAQWAAAQSDWHAESATIQGRPATLRWHRAAIFGPHEVVASVGKDFSLHIVTAGQPPKAEEGYLLTCTGSGTQVEAALLRK
ncbi:MAG: hypothetical protein FJ279_05945, partial [Planctomycetes bacterium]|nr:hypothetical protein [Planctomycetota bacterium]